MNSPTSNWIIVKIDSLSRFSFLDFTPQTGEDELSVRFCLDISLDSGSQLIGKIGKIGCLLYVDKDNDDLECQYLLLWNNTLQLYVNI